MTKQEFNKLIMASVTDLHLPQEITDKFKAINKKRVRDIIYYSKEWYLSGYVVFNRTETEIIQRKLNQLGLDFKPVNYTIDQWLDELENRLVRDINDIPEQYRETYAIGAGVKAERAQREQGLISRRIKTNTTPAPYKRKREGIVMLHDNEILNEVKQNIKTIQGLDKWFIQKYTNELITMVFEEKYFGTDTKTELIKYIVDVCSGKILEDKTV